MDAFTQGDNLLIVAGLRDRHLGLLLVDSEMAGRGTRPSPGPDCCALRRSVEQHLVCGAVEHSGATSGEARRDQREGDEGGGRDWSRGHIPRPMAHWLTPWVLTSG